MNLQVFEQELSVCKLPDARGIDLSNGLTFVGVTDEEISLVCPTPLVPQNAIAREDGWRAFRVQGVLDFSLTGILARISSVLANAQVGIFAVSTYDTDYILVKAPDFMRALDALRVAGFGIAQ